MLYNFRIKNNLGARPSCTSFNSSLYFSCCLLHAQPDGEALYTRVNQNVEGCRDRSAKPESIETRCSMQA